MIDKLLNQSLPNAKQLREAKGAYKVIHQYPDYASYEHVAIPPPP